MSNNIFQRSDDSQKPCHRSSNFSKLSKNDKPDSLTKDDSTRDFQMINIHKPNNEETDYFSNSNSENRKNYNHVIKSLKRVEKNAIEANKLHGQKFNSKYCTIYM